MSQQPGDARALLVGVRQSLREKNGLNVALSVSTESPPTPVKHRVQVLEHSPDKANSAPALVSERQALSHSTSATWRHLQLDTGKSAWQREEKEGDETIAGEHLYVSASHESVLQQPLLDLPQGMSLQQAHQAVQTLQQQVFLELRKLQGVKVLARQAAENLYSCQQQSAHAAADSNASATEGQAHTAEAECRLKLASVQSHMLELSQEVSLAELALELAEARYNIMLAAGDQPCAPGSCSAKPNLRKLLKQLSDASHSMPRPAEATHIGHGESDSGAEAQAVHITTGDEVQDVSPASGSTTHSSEVICSSRSGADSPVSCHSATTSVLSPATPAATQTNIAAVLLDSFENSEQPAATCQASDSPATSNDGWSQSPSASDSASNAFDVDSGVSEAIQDCSDLIAQIKGKLSQPKQTTSSWQGVTVRCMASALALSAGVAAACTYWGLHEYAINWFPT